MKKVNKKVLKRLKKNEGNILNYICLATGMFEQTVRRWVKLNDVKLTTATTLDVIKERFDLKDEEILETVSGKTK